MHGAPNPSPLPLARASRLEHECLTTSIGAQEVGCGTPLRSVGRLCCFRSLDTHTQHPTSASPTRGQGTAKKTLKEQDKKVTRRFCDHSDPNVSLFLLPIHPFLEQKSPRTTRKQKEKENTDKQRESKQHCELMMKFGKVFWPNLVQQAFANFICVGVL